MVFSAPKKLKAMTSELLYSYHCVYRTNFAFLIPSLCVKPFTTGVWSPQARVLSLSFNSATPHSRLPLKLSVKQQSKQMLCTTFAVPISNNSIKILPLAVQRRKEEPEREGESQVSMRANPICFLFTLTLLLLLGLAQPTSTAPDLSPAFLPSPAPPPTAGGDFSSPPSRGWGGWVSSSPSSHSPAPETPPPLVPREGTPSALTPAGAPEGGDGIPFLSSNPAVPLPTGMTDTATYRPLPTPGDGTQAVGLASPTVAVGWRLALVFAMMMCCFALGPWM